MEEIMQNDEAKHQHLIPRSYMSAWANKSGTVDVEFLNNKGTLSPRNVQTIAGINDYYSIKAGMVICTKEDTDKLFAPLANYTVEINSMIVTDTMVMNKEFYDFDNWIIRRPNGDFTRKKHIKREIEKIKIKDIEKNWAIKYENDWKKVVSDLESKISILSTKSIYIPAIYRDYLMKFYVALDWRSIKSNQDFKKTFSRLYDKYLYDIGIPENDRILPFLKSVKDEIEHMLLLKYYREFLDDNGIIYKRTMEGLKYTNFHFFITNGSMEFITSDNPSFYYTRNDGLLEGIMPITPRILMSQGRCNENEDRYSFSYISEEKVKYYNKIIEDNAAKFVIHSKNQLVNERK